MQVAVARLLGYRWPAELHPAMELSAESRALVESCKAFDRFADDDGIVCIPRVNREKPAANRLLEVLAGAYGKEWFSHTISELLSASDWANKLGATVRVNAAKALKDKLELILKGEAPYDIFVRWKSLA